MCGDTVCCLKPSGWDVAHNIARSEGGDPMMDNLRVSCPACNRYTGTLPFDDEKRRRQEETQTTDAQLPVVFESDSYSSAFSPSSAPSSDTSDAEHQRECLQGDEQLEQELQ